jgi:PAS domain S-box-containing protein
MDGTVGRQTERGSGQSRRRSAERDLYRLSRAFQFSNEAMVITDEGSRILDLNEAAVRVLGASDRGELLGTVGLSLLVPSDLGRATEAMETAEPTPNEGLLYTIMGKTGSVRQVEVFSTPIPGEGGATEGFIILIRHPPVSRSVSSPI